MKKNESFEEYYLRKVQEENDLINSSPLSLVQIKKIYQEEYALEQEASSLTVKMKPQKVDYETVSLCLPEKWEMLRPGMLLGSDEELLRALKLLIFNSGVEATLDLIPEELIREYLETKHREDY